MMARLTVNSWELTAKPTPTIYQGLNSKLTLKSITIKSPSQRVVRPVCLLPPIPGLQALKVTDIDPLNYPDDFSLLLLESKRLEELNLHWSPRMREQGEPSINLHSLFHKCIAAGYRIPLKRLGIQNLYALNHGELQTAINNETIERISFINNVDSSNPRTFFFDQTWMRGNPKELPKNVKMMRGEGMDRQHAEVVSRLSGLEEFYIISKNGSSRKTTSNGSRPNGGTPNGVSPAPPSNSEPPTPSLPPERTVAIASDYLAALTQHHGRTLCKVLLSDQWRIGEAALSNLVKCCPNLEQLGVSLEDSITVLRRVMPMAPNLYALRILEGIPMVLWDKLADIEDDIHILGMQQEFSHAVFKRVKWVGMGHKVFQIGDAIQAENTTSKRGSSTAKRAVKCVPWEKVKHIEIFGYDCMELI